MKDSLRCKACGKYTNAIYRLAQEDICMNCFNRYFDNANPMLVSEYLTRRFNTLNTQIRKHQSEIDDLNHIADSYHNICANYEQYCDKSQELHLKDLKDIYQVVDMYGKGLGGQIYNKHIKPMLEHITYKINKIQGDKHE